MVNFSMVWKEINNFSKIVAKIQDKEILIGYPYGLPHTGGEGESISEIAKKLFFGTDSIPARPFLVDAISLNEKDLDDEMKEYWKTATSPNGNISVKVSRIGAKAVGMIKEFVRGDFYRDTEPNSPYTIQKKSRKNKKGVITGLSDIPLIDTAEMINSTTYVVRKS